MIQMKCPYCGRHWEVNDYLRGMTVICKNCAHKVPVPASQEQETRTSNAIVSAPASALLQDPASASAFQQAPEAIQRAGDISPTPTTPDPALKQPETRSIVFDISECPSLPDWAVERAKAGLRIGLGVQAIEQQLVAHGLPAATAAAVVASVLEKQVHLSFVSPAHREHRWIWTHRILSLIVWCVCLFLAYLFNGCTLREHVAT